MNLKFLCDAANISCPREAASLEIGSIVTDSRRAQRGSLFICICGICTDGHRYAKQAAENGCNVILTAVGHRVDVPEDVTVLVTSDTRQASALLYHAWYGFPTKALCMIGVTGTNGKTTVTHMLRRILELAGYRCGLIGTVGCESNGARMDSRADDPLANMTTPDPEVLYRLLAEMVRDGAEYAVMEVSSHALALEKVAPICFDVGIFTNLTEEHLDFHQTMDSYAQAKAKLFSQSCISILNADSPYASLMEQRASGKCVRCSQVEWTDAYADEIEFSQEGVAYRLHTEDTDLLIKCPSLGDFCLMNSLQAAMAALNLGISPEQVVCALADFNGAKGRMERVKLENADFQVLIDYAHTPDALERLLKSVQCIKKPGGRVVLLFGCGGDRDPSKRQPMGRIASSYADFVIITSDNSRSEDPMQIIEKICEGISSATDYRVIPDRRWAIRFAIAEARKDDLILLAGKGHEEYEIIRDEIRPFSEKKIVQECYVERLKQKHNDNEREADL